MAGLALVLAFVWLLPSATKPKSRLADPVFFILWIVAFGFIVSFGESYVSARSPPLFWTLCKSIRGH